MNIPDISEIIAQNLEELRACPLGMDCEKCAKDICVAVVSVADFPTKYGHFKIIGFVNNRDRKDHIVILKGDLGDGENLLARVLPPALPAMPWAAFGAIAGHSSIARWKGSRKKDGEPCFTTRKRGAASGS